MKNHPIIDIIESCAALICTTIFVIAIVVDCMSDEVLPDCFDVIEIRLPNDANFRPCTHKLHQPSISSEFGKVSLSCLCKK